MMPRADITPTLDSNESVTQPELNPSSAKNVGGLPDDSNIVIIDEGGDMHFVVLSKNGTGSKTWLVSSSCVRLASPVWANAINTLSADEFGKLRLEVVDDLDNIIEIALRATHLQHRYLPLRLSFSKLVEIAEVCERHDLIRLLEPYLKPWASRWSAKILAPGYELWVFIAYQFGYFEIFQLLSEHLAEDMRMSEGGDWFCGNFNLSTSKVKGVILDNLIRMREEHINSIVEDCSLYERIYSDEPNFCPFDDEANGCTMLYLGTLVRHFRRCRLTPDGPEANGHRDSVNEIRERLVDIKISDYHSNKFRAIYCRSGCNAGLSVSIFASRNKVVVALQDSDIRKHFQTVRENMCVAPLLSWEYVAKMRMGFLERDFDISGRYEDHRTDRRIDLREGCRKAEIAQDVDLDVVMQDDDSSGFTTAEVEASDKEESSNGEGDRWSPDSSDLDSDYETEEDPSEPDEEFKDDISLNSEEDEPANDSDGESD